MYSDHRVKDFIAGRFIPIRVHVKDDREEWERLGARFGAQWTPTILIVDSDGEERHRIEGFLPVDDLLSQLALGAAHAAFKRKEHAAAEPLFRDVADRYPQTDAAPEALYWAGVSRYRAANDAGALKATAAVLSERYPASAWNKKASVWR